MLGGAWHAGWGVAGPAEQPLVALRLWVSISPRDYRGRSSGAWAYCLLGVLVLGRSLGFVLWGGVPAWVECDGLRVRGSGGGCRVGVLGLGVRLPRGVGASGGSSSSARVLLGLPRHLSRCVA